MSRNLARAALLIIATGCPPPAPRPPCELVCVRWGEGFPGIDAGLTSCMRMGCDSIDTPAGLRVVSFPDGGVWTSPPPDADTPPPARGG